MRPFDPSPKTYIASPNRNVQYTVEFISSQPIDAEALEKAIRIRAINSDGQGLLVNGESSILLVLQPYGYSVTDEGSPNEEDREPRQDIVISKSSKQ